MLCRFRSFPTINYDYSDKCFQYLTGHTPKSKGKLKKRTESTKKVKPEKPATAVVTNSDSESHLHNSLDNCVELGDILSSKSSAPKKRCLRSSSNEEKEVQLSASAPGPSYTSRSPPPPLPKKSESGASCSKKCETNKSSARKISKSSKSTSKEIADEKSTARGETRGRKTGSCASSRYSFVKVSYCVL